MNENAVEATGHALVPVLSKYFRGCAEQNNNLNMMLISGPRFEPRTYEVLFAEHWTVL
jgi:hypothetical protein